jgi:hypothetical protein
VKLSVDGLMNALWGRLMDPKEEDEASDGNRRAV